MEHQIQVHELLAESKWFLVKTKGSAVNETMSLDSAEISNSLVSQIFKAVLPKYPLAWDHFMKKATVEKQQPIVMNTAKPLSSLWTD